MADWLGLTVEPNAEPFPDEAPFLAEARALLDQLRPIRAANTWAASLRFGLILVLPLDRARGWPLKRRGSLHTSLQLMMRSWNDRPEIVGDWQDAHYAWDYEPKQVPFRVDGHGASSRAQALSWLTAQMRRPVIRDDWLAFGVTLCSRWRQPDEPDTADARPYMELRGFFPIGLVRHDRPSRSAPAGFFDPW
jgi:hypothetical protein